MIIDDNGIRLKAPKNRSHPNFKPAAAGFKGLTPEQLRNLRRLGDGKIRVIVKNTPTPTPKPTP